MAQVENVEAQNLEYQKVEELFEDRDAEVFDTILLNRPVATIKQKLKMIKDQGTDIHNVYQSYIHLFTTNQTLNCPEFVECCALNCSDSKRVIMDTTNSKIIFPVSSLVIRKSFSVPTKFDPKSREYNEESIVQCFRESVIEKKHEVFKKCFKPYVQLLY